MQDYPRRLFGFDSQALIQLIGGLVIGLIAIYTSNEHINLCNRSYPINQQWGIWFIAASLAVVAVEFVQYSAPLGRDAQLATQSRRREEDRRIEDARTAIEERDRAAEARERAARREAAQLRRARVEAEASRAQLAYSVDPSTAQRAQLEQALSKLSSPEVPGASV